jgi:hypothetical protein
MDKKQMETGEFYMVSHTFANFSLFCVSCAVSLKTQLLSRLLKEKTRKLLLLSKKYTQPKKTQRKSSKI